MAKKPSLCNPSSLPGNFRSRVFIGGSYKAVEALSRPAPREMLDALQRIALREGLDPIIADGYAVDDFDRDVHHDAIFLLHACRLAIFELSEFSGALMEIERSADFGTMCLVLHSDPKGLGWKLSRMLSSFVREHHSRIRLYGYTTSDDAVSAARNWLREMKELGHAKS
jgi:hypothetical protein